MTISIRNTLIGAAFCSGLAACAGGGGSARTPTASATPVSSATPTPSVPVTIIPTRTTTAEVPSTANAPATATPPATATATLTTTATVTATDTASLTPTASPTVTATPETCADPQVHAREPLCALDDATVTCDFLIAAKCLLPYPSSVFLRPDASTPTGFRLNYERDALPMNKDGVHVDPTEWNTLDGFSPGPLIQAFFPAGVDLEASAVPRVTEADIARSIGPESPTVLIDAVSGEHIAHFVELDAQASGPSTQMFLIRPAVRLRDGHRYIVAIRGLIGLDGEPIAPERPFQILRDRLATPVRVINARRAPFEDIFAALGAAGVERTSLQLAWDFVTASGESLTGRALSVRDQGLAANGPGAPAFTVDSVEDNVNEDTARRVIGHYTVPQFMQSPTPPTRLNLDADGRPLQNGTTTAPFLVNIPRSAMTGGVAQPARPVVYGHGLLGTNDEVNAGHLQNFDNAYNFIVGGTNWIGLSAEDLLPTVLFTNDISGFPALPDRLHQAVLNFILLGRLFIAPDGFVSDPAFQLDGQPLIDRSELFYYGISQGGISGGFYMALAPDTVRGVLGVGAANFSMLLQRSIEFTVYQQLINATYPDELDHQLLIGLIQQVWDRADPQSYLPHLLADPFPGTPAKKILMQIGLYDSQVANIGTAYEARSLAIPNLAPTIFPLFGVPEMAAPFDGSAFVPYDVNAVFSPTTNTAPAVDNGVHEAVRRLDAARRQIDAFLRSDGRVENFCDGPCFFTGVPDVLSR